MLTPGTRVGPYEVISPLGAGGMGEVYRARDTVLGRDVALKTLPAEFSRDAERLTRLRREARLLGSLNHPGIATLHGLEECDGAPVLVMEVVEGETLSDRLRRGPLSLKETLRIGQQVAEAVAAAHDKGVLHRDLKPANVRITKESRAKVLDFGLARADEETERADPDEATHTSPVSRFGVALGTAPYMSPEQLQGQDVDARTDVWAFGCLLYEMLTGKRAFPGPTSAETAAAILERGADFGALPETTPVPLLRLLRRCLRQDREERLHDLADAALELRELLAEMSSGAPVATLGSSGKAAIARAHGALWPKAGAGALFVVAAAGIGLLMSRDRRSPSTGETRQPRFEATLPRAVALPPLHFLQGPLALSPDGHRVALVGCGADGCKIYLRERQELDARPLSGTDGAASPFFSPDGRWIAFSNGQKLKKLALQGGAEVTLADAPRCCGGSWGEDGTILFSRGRSGLIRVSADGGEAREVTRLDAARGERDHRWPQHLPGGRAALFGIYSDLAKHSAAVVDLQTGRWRVLLENASSPRYSSTGHVVFGRSGVLYAAPFDARRLELTGPAVPVLEHVAMWNSPGPTGSVAGNVYYALAPDGTLVFSPREARLPKRRLVWLDRQGRATPLAARQETYISVKLSPDGTRLAATVQTELDTRIALVLDIAREAWTRVAFQGEAAYRGGPRVHSWMPDGKRLLLEAVSESQPHLLLVEADTVGPAEKLHVGESAFAEASPDRRSVLFCAQTAPGVWDIWRLQLEGARKPEPFLATAGSELLPSFSPDGRFVAHASNESGRQEVYVRSYPGPGSAHVVSTQGGSVPRWSRDGREIFFVLQGALMSAAVRTSPSVSSEPPRKLFTLPEGIAVEYSRFGDVAPDGQRFAAVERDPAELRPLGLAIVPNWTAELQARVAAAAKR